LGECYSVAGDTQRGKGRPGYFWDRNRLADAEKAYLRELRGPHNPRNADFLRAEPFVMLEATYENAMRSRQKEY
jgi:hypothetical protein